MSDRVLVGRVGPPPVGSTAKWLAGDTPLAGATLLRTAGLASALLRSLAVVVSAFVWAQRSWRLAAPPEPAIDPLATLIWAVSG